VLMIGLSFGIHNPFFCWRFFRVPKLTLCRILSWLIYAVEIPKKASERTLLFPH
jgi:hypothetical protein